MDILDCTLAWQNNWILFRYVFSDKHIKKDIFISYKYRDRKYIHFNMSSFVYLKGYLCYKKINSQNKPSQAQVKNFFVWWESYIPFSRYSSFVFLTIQCFTKFVTSWWVLVHETGYIFEYIFWTTNN